MSNVVGISIHIVEIVNRWVKLIHNEVQIYNVQENDVASCDKSEHLLPFLPQYSFYRLFDSVLIAAIVQDIDSTCEKWYQTGDDND